MDDRKFIQRCAETFCVSGTRIITLMHTCDGCGVSATVRLETPAFRHTYLCGNCHKRVKAEISKIEHKS
jgi:hypothetical protein